MPFKYDLGGTVVDTAGLTRVLERRYGEVCVDTVMLRSWNLSYLAGHAPVVSCALPGGEAELGGCVWVFDCRLRVFPWLGVLSVDFTFTPGPGQEAPDPERFYDDLVVWKNQDYVPYLRRCDALSDSLDLRIPPEQRALTEDRHGAAVRDLRAAVAGFVEPRPFCYAFHDFRLCFLGTPEELPDAVAGRLLWFAGPSPTTGGGIEPLGLGGLEVASSGWSTVIRGARESIGTEADSVTMLLNLIHAQWYVCQLWINAHNLRGQGGGSGWQLADPHVLSANRTALAHDLSEVDNLNVMLKDPGLLRVAEYLETSLKVHRHREAAMARLHALEDHSRQLADHRAEIELRRFQALFAISAAAGVASLVPALAQVGFTALHVVTTVTLLLGFLALFAVDFTVVRRWWTRRRRP
ncbi:hypothetical protein ABT095_29470 [Kitasatospora sp. NPDC002227]|uniref:hypothetical protein n=1 Tax=Kitasatospora sp. NPDC002227 TaxID=3154773 RepID=UPI00332C982B